MKILRCKESFRVGGRSGPSGLDEGDLVPDTHPLAKQSPGHFEPVEDFVRRRHRALLDSGVEQATAAPGERRTVAPAPSETSQTSRKRGPGRPPKSEKKEQS